MIVFIKPGGYEHFAVLKGVRGDRSTSPIRRSATCACRCYRFFDMWADESGRGVIFAVERVTGGWPQSYPLQLAGTAEPPLELLSAERMMSIGAPFPTLAPNK